MTDATLPGDAAGAETLEIMSAAPRYNAWQYERIAPFLGRRILEVGSGIGNMSEHLLGGPIELLVLTDMDPWYRDQLRIRFGSRPDLVVESLVLPDHSAAERFSPYRLDTVVALNVLEHIENDVESLIAMGALMGSGGRVVILVPALESVYGSLDVELGHFRRYSRERLARAFDSAGLQLERLTWFNRIGTIGWWINACVRQQKRIPLAQLRSFDSLVPLLRFERFIPLPFGQSLIAVGTVP